MKDLVLADLFPVLGVGFLLWLVYDAVTKFGWRGLLLKVTLYINGAFIMFAILFHEAPWTLARTHGASLAGNPSRIAAGVVWLLVSYLIVPDHPMRWLNKAPLQWISGLGVLFWGATLFIAAEGRL